MKTVATPGFISALQEFGLDVLLFPPARIALSHLSKGGEPSWVIGDPSVQPGRCLSEDSGRTLRIPVPFSFYAIRDDHDPTCSCGCGGDSLVTFLLPEEY